MLGLSRSASPITMRKDGLGFRDSTVASGLRYDMRTIASSVLRLSEGRRVKGVGA
jgi:hypothetical protein